MKKRCLALLLAFVLLLGLTIPVLGTEDDVVFAVLGDDAAAGVLPYGQGFAQEAFPLLAARERAAQLRDLTVPGMTAWELAGCLETDETYRAALSDADVVLVSIGGRDLFGAFAATLAPLCGEATADAAALEAAIAQTVTQDAPNAGQVLTNLRNLLGVLTEPATEELYRQALRDFDDAWTYILQLLQELNPNALVVAVGLYNPYAAFAGYESAGIYLDQIGSYWTGQLNNVLEDAEGFGETYTVYRPQDVSCGAYAYLDRLFDVDLVDAGLLDDLVSLDPLPDQAGQQTLAGGVLKALKNLELNQPVELSFRDVQPEDDAYEDVRLVYNAGLMEGVSERWFDLEGTLNRAMVVTILYRLAGRPDTSWDFAFWDVRPEVWYASAVQWASDSGVTLGSGDGSFEPDAIVSAEQLAAFMYRYAQQDGMDTSIRDEVLAQAQALVELRTLDGWAVDCVAWALSGGMMDLDVIRPNEPATRGDTVRFLAALLS